MKPVDTEHAAGGGARKRRQWSDHDDAFIRRNAHKGAAALADIMGVSRKGLQMRASRIGASLPAPGEWTAEQDAVLRDNAAKGAAAVAALVGRSPLGVRARAAKIGVTFGRGRKTGPMTGGLPIVRQLFEIKKQQRVTDIQLAGDSGLGANMFSDWRRLATGAPRLDTFEAAANALGWRLALVPMDAEDGR